MEKYYYMEVEGRGCGIRTGKNIEEIQEEINCNHGPGCTRYVRLATEDDLDWVRGMGGFIPENGYIFTVLGNDKK